MMTYWLYHNNQPLTAVRGEVGLNDSQVRFLVSDAEASICCRRPGETPTDFKSKVMHSEVRIHE